MTSHRQPYRTHPEFSVFTGESGDWRARIYDKFNAYLAEAGLKPTHQRHSILGYLLDANMHLTAEEVYTSLRRKDPTIGKATVFRTLNLLEEAGIASRVLRADGKPHFEIKLLRPHHDHAICIECGAIQEIKSDLLERYQEEAAAEIGFKPLWHRHEIFGRCKACVSKR